MAISIVLGPLFSEIPALAATPGGPAVIQSLKNDISAPLRTLRASPVAPSGKGNQSHRPLHPGQSGTKLPTAPNSIQTSAGAAAMPSTSTNFEGINNIDGVLPPDTNGDVGPNNYVQWVNLHYQVFDRTGASLLGPSPGNTLWSGFGGLCEFTNQGDPVVRYDRMANRWVFTQFAFSVNRKGAPVAPYDQCFAVSTTGDPTGAYYRYAWTISNTYFPDYPKLAVWPDAYYMTVNYFSGLTFVGGGALAFDRSKMLNGQAATGIGFGPLGAAYGGSLPSDLDGSILPPSGAPNYFGAIDTSVSPSGSTFQIWKFHVDFTTPSNSTFGSTSSHTPNFNLAVDTYFWNMCNGLRSCVQQPGTSQGLDAISDRLMNRLQYRRFADGHESLVANHTVGVGSGNNQAAIRWYEIRNLATTPTIYQQSTYAPSSDNRWMGSIAMDQSGDIALGYSVSSSSVSPSILYTGRLASDPLASLPQGEATLIAGSGSQTSSFNRWGDYSMMAVDPTDDCTFWYTQEYYAVTSTAGWQTRVGSFKFAGCGLPATPTNLTATAICSSQIDLAWTASAGAASYNIQRSIDSATWAQIATTATTSYSDSSLTASSAYYYRVQASNSIGASGYSNSASATTPGAKSCWSALYGVTNTPTNWVTSLAQTYTVTLTNNGFSTWNAGGTNPVGLEVSFSTTGGGVNSGTHSAWQGFLLPSDVPSGGSLTMTITVTPPSQGGVMYVEYQMVKSHEFWFNQYANVAATVTNLWSAVYGVTNTPTSWVTSQAQTYTVTLTNNGFSTWNAGGTNPVGLEVSFSTTGGGVNSGTHYAWQGFLLPSDVPSGGSLTMTITVTPPSQGGSMYVEYQMVKAHEFWFNQYANVAATVTNLWSAVYGVTNTPTSWVTNQTQTYTVTLTNNGFSTWNAGGTNPVGLEVSFSTTGGGVNSGTHYAWQGFLLPSDVPSGGSLAMTITVTPPSQGGSMYVEYQMVKAHEFWFNQYANVVATVS